LRPSKIESLQGVKLRNKIRDYLIKSDFIDMHDSKAGSPAADVPSISFFSLMGFFFAELLRLARKIVSFIFRHKILLGVLTIAGMATGVALYKVTPSSYKMSILIKPTDLEASVFGQMIKGLNDLASTGASSELARSLKIAPHEAGKITQITGQSLQGVDLAKDTAVSNIGRPFILDAMVSDNEFAIPLQDALINYFNTNEYLSKLRVDKLQMMNQKLAFINAELAKLDSLKTQYNLSLAMTKTPSMYYNAMDPAKIYEASSKYYLEKNKIEEWIRQGKDVVVKIESAKPSIAASSSNIYKMVIIYGLIFFCIGALIILLRGKTVV
jgi:hypothetical protein